MSAETRRPDSRVAILAGLLLLAGCRGTEPASPPPANLAMAERLASFAGTDDAVDAGYRNDASARRLEEQLAASTSPDINRLVPLAIELIRAGRSADALERLDQIEARMRDAGMATPDNLIRLADWRGIAWLRLGEQENCIRNHTTDSCVLPIRGNGVHTVREPSQAAVELYSELLRRGSRDLKHVWLLNLAHMTLGQYPEGVPAAFRIPASAFESELDVGRFHDVAPAAGVATTALLGGAALDDFDGDGDLDLFASSWLPTDPLRYYRNEADGTFVERTGAAHLDGLNGGANLVHADYDNDGFPDLFVMRGGWLGSHGKHPNSLLRNRGDGSFEDVTEAAGLLTFHPSQTAAFGDFDNDGRLDLFVGNESPAGGAPSELWRQNPDGTFTDVAAEVGVDRAGFVKGAVWGDYDNDGRLDLYLSRYGQTNVLYHNDGPSGAGTWRFSDRTAEAGVAEPRRSFPTWFFDYDNDGWLDLFVGSFAGFGGDALRVVVADFLGADNDGERCRLFRNRGDGTFEDVSARTATDRVLLVMGANFGDLDNDGWLDLYLGTGEPTLTTLVPNVALRNDGGRRFQDVTTSGGFGNVQKGHGVAFGDVDGDGDQDVYVVMGGAYSGDVYQNILYENPGHGHRWLTLRLRGTEANRLAVGARVAVSVEDEGGRVREIHRVVGSGGSFGSSSLWLEIGLGAARRITRLEIRWPGSGKVSTFDEVPLDSVVAIREGSSNPEIVDGVSFALPRHH
jgi:hypothetical protein